jgi:hypothetical protein
LCVSFSRASVQAVSHELQAANHRIGQDCSSCHADDMEIAPDFFDYFEATAPILDVDESLYAVSSWNDNGQTQFVHNSGKVSSHFPVAQKSAYLIICVASVLLSFRFCIVLVYSLC